jgi:hypothetical protein
VLHLGGYQHTQWKAPRHESFCTRSCVRGHWQWGVTSLDVGPCSARWSIDAPNQLVFEISSSQLPLSRVA